jgi:hypothetical protein
MVRIAMNTLAATLLGSWLLLSILVLVPRLKLIIRRWDAVMLIPQWSFFAPEPAFWDFHLLYRDRYPDGTYTEWTEAIPPESRRWWSFVWNPGKRQRKALFDAVVELSGRVQLGDRSLEASISYLTLLTYVTSIMRTAKPELMQFAIVRTLGINRRAPDAIFRSKAHSV